MSGTHVGKKEIKKWFQHLIKNGPKRTFYIKTIAVQNLYDVVGNNVVAVEWDNKVETSTG